MNHSRFVLIAFVHLLVAAPYALGDELPAGVAKKAVDRFLAEVEEIERVSALRRAEAKARLDRALRAIEQFEVNQESGGKRYHGMLGSYFSHKGRMPFFMLSVPDGSNVLSEQSRRLFNSRHSGGDRLYKFESRGHVIIPRDGRYRLEVSRAAGIKLNGVEYAVGSPVAGQRPYADVPLEEGVYDVEFDVGNNGGQMNYSMIRIVDRETDRELPIFIYQSELEKFRGDLSLGVELLETSQWDQNEFEIQ